MRQFHLVCSDELFGCLNKRLDCDWLGDEFVATMTIILRGDNDASIDNFRLNFTPPPYENVVVTIQRGRRYAPNERTTSNILESALVRLYGKPLQRKKILFSTFYSWFKKSSTCDGMFADHSRGYVLNSSGSILTLLRKNVNCSAVFDVSVKTTGDKAGGTFDDVNTVKTNLIDYPTLMLTHRKLNELTRAELLRERKKTLNRAGPSDL